MVRALPHVVMSRSSRNESQLALREQGDAVLRYWLSALRLEEALQLRPMARPIVGSEVVPRLDQPSPGQDYFKVPLDGPCAELLSKESPLTRAFDPELCRFFEAWLHGRYRRGDDEGELSHLLCFPVVHLAQGELSGLVRCSVRLGFSGAGSKPFRPPTRSERRRGAYPPAPDLARLIRAPQTDGAWPFFVDTRLLHRTLRVPPESIDAFFEALRTLPSVSEERMLALLTAMLERVASHAEADPESVGEQAARLTAAASSAPFDAWLERLTTVLRRLLEQCGSRARVYPVGIVIDATRAKTTWHLQREIESLVAGERGGWDVASPLGAYLTGQPLPAGEAPQRALFPGPALSASQRAAAESFWGSPLSAVQGPPGTGKTRLILHLCAEAVVRQAESLVSGNRSRSELLLVTSSNNRAVDNVLEPLGDFDGLPLALRAGSRQVCEQYLQAQLRRALDWLERAAAETSSARAERWAHAQAQFRARRAALEPRRAAQARAATRARLEQELAQCTSREDGPAALPISLPHAQALLLAIEPLQRRLRALSKLCEGSPTLATLHAVQKHYKRTTKRYLSGLTQALERANSAFDLPLPPPARPGSVNPEQQLEDWEEAAEQSLSRLTELGRALRDRASGDARAARARTLRAQLLALGSEPARDDARTEAHECEERELFAAAVAAREAWAGAHADELARATSAALRCVEQERSLRPLFRENTDAARSLCQLFGIWGSTLLSLGNCFPTELTSGTRVVIDEAGQCHPAHAVSALLRAESALVIGDVHQLTPVIEITVDDEARLLRSSKLTAPIARWAPYRVHAEATNSSQSLADRAVSARGKLTDHFRCQPEIIGLSDALCGYGLSVHTPRADRSSLAPYLRHPLLLVDVQGQQERWGGSWCNEHELDRALSLTDSLLRRGVQPEEIAIITPYRGQLERLHRGLSERRIPLETSAENVEAGGSRRPERGLALGTVHRFQGGERSIVVFTTVVTHPASLAFLNARPNLLNVAISRAQHHFVCVGHAAVLGHGARSRLLIERARPLSPAAYGDGLATAEALFAARSPS